MGCICERKAVYDEFGIWDCLKNEKCIAINGDVNLACGVDDEGFYLSAYGEVDLAEWHPFYCPICGRKLKDPDKSFQSGGGQFADMPTMQSAT